MKIRHQHTIVCMFLLLLLAACSNDDPIAEGNTKAPDPDSTAQESLNEASDSNSVQKLLKQYDPPGRDVWQKPEVVIAMMGDLSSKKVADIGAGSGFFSRRLAQQAKHVIAVELDPRFIHFMDSIKRVELKPEYQNRFETRLATPTDPKLKPGEVDIVLVVNTYIYIQDRVAYLKTLLNVLPEGGKIIIVDFKKKRMPIKYPTASHRVELYEVEDDLEAAGFSNFESDDCSLDYQYIVMAEK